MTENNKHKWKVTRCKILLTAGIVLIFVYLILTELLQEPFHYEWIIAGLALCGIGITQNADKKNH